jgi:hypothetical protein
MKARADHEKVSRCLCIQLYNAARLFFQQPQRGCVVYSPETYLTGVRRHA